MTSVGVMASAVNIATGLPYAMWLDATDAATFTYTATPPQVAIWQDKAAGYTFVTQTPGTGVIRNATINGLTAVNFNGNFQQMNCDNLDTRTFVDPVNFTDHMAFFVMRFSDTTRQDLYLQGTSTTPRLAFDFRAAATNIDVANNSTARLTGTTTVAAATPYLYAAYRNGATMKLYRNGTELLSRTDASGAMTSLPTADPILGRAGNCRLDLGEMILIAGYNAAQFAAVQAALKAKWGTP